MGNRVGIILHEDWFDFSPLMYSHNGAEYVVIELKKYLTDYVGKYNLDNHDGHLYAPCHMMVEFIQALDSSNGIRVENLSDTQIDKLVRDNNYTNYFEGGCWIVNVSTKNYGKTISGDIYTLENNNIVYDELKNNHDEDIWRLKYNI